MNICIGDVDDFEKELKLELKLGLDADKDKGRANNEAKNGAGDKTGEGSKEDGDLVDMTVPAAGVLNLVTDLVAPPPEGPQPMDVEDKDEDAAAVPKRAESLGWRDIPEVKLSEDELCDL